MAGRLVTPIAHLVVMLVMTWMTVLIVTLEISLAVGVSLDPYAQHAHVEELAATALGSPAATMATLGALIAVPALIVWTCTTALEVFFGSRAWAPLRALAFVPIPLACALLIASRHALQLATLPGFPPPQLAPFSWFPADPWTGWLPVVIGAAVTVLLALVLNARIAPPPPTRPTASSPGF